EIADLLITKKITEAEILKMEKKKHFGRYPLETEKELIAYVQGGDKQKATGILNSLLGEIFSFAAGNIDTIRVRVFELLAFLSRAAVDAGAPLKDVNLVVKKSQAILADDADFERVCYLTSEAMEGFIDVVYAHKGGGESRHMSNAIAYIMKNYAEELTLSKVAGAVYVSSYYLSHLFREELNTTFSEYVLRLRIDKARELLKDKNVKIQEVAYMTGFNDANYFAKAFKKHTGISPKEYHSLF
ncbi:MAG: AraC family transcriptional regulator, partial [Clostridiales bacterium]|nr:AraC family transcriptional regulator [Clostridiales bacterium]